MHRKLIVCVVAGALWVFGTSCDDESDPGADADADVDADADADADVDADADADPDHVPVGQDCTEDHLSCPDRYECFCSAPAPGLQRCACGLECDDRSDCTDDDQPVCCYGTCTDAFTCNNF